MAASRDTLQTAASAQSLDIQEDNEQDSGDNIRVYVRVRPPSEREQAAGSMPIVTFDCATSSVLLRGDQPRTFTFDGVLGDDSNQEETFDLVGRSIGASCLSGYNGSVYVYGQTGTGKTYTMCGPISSMQSMQFDERRGLICRILDYVFAEISRRRAQTDAISYLCRCSFLEIYKEQITDLLEPSCSNLQVREDVSRGIYVERLTEQTAWSLTEAFQVLWRGTQQRHVGATQMNERSSRSHAVFTLAIEVASTRAGVTSTRVARLSLVDLAGSERQALDSSGTTPFQSLRVKEAGAINKSLSALTNVIMSLSRASTSRRKSGVEGERRPYVHYRDSKLTFLLRDSLGGNSKTVIVANASPSALCFAETLSTLKFAARAKHIRCAAVRNEEFSGTVDSLMSEVKTLRAQLAQLSSRSFSVSRSRLNISESVATLGGDDSKEGVDEADEVQVLYSRKRVRRLEVLLAAALERERLADQRRHQLQRLAEFLEDLDFRKSQYLRRLHRDYSTLSGQIREVAETEGGDEAPELTAKFVSFSDLLANLVAGSKRGVPSPGGGASASTLPSSGLGAGECPEDRPSPGAGGMPLARPGRKRGTSQSLQRAAPGGAGTGPGAELPSEIGAGFPGGLVDESCFLREENQRLRQQLEHHPEMYRLAAENRALRDRLQTIDAVAGKRRSAGGGGAKRSARGGHGAKQGLRRERSLTRTSRSTLIGTLSLPGREGAESEPQFETQRTPTNSSDEDSSGGESDKADLAGGHALSSTYAGDDASGYMQTTPPVTSKMMLRLAETDDDSTLRTWVYFQKMAKEVEELLRAKESLAVMVKDLRTNEGHLMGQRRLTSGSKDSQSKTPVSLVEPRIVEDLVQTTHDALSLAQAIIDAKNQHNSAQVDPVDSSDEVLHSMDGIDDKDGSPLTQLLSHVASGVQKHQRLISSSGSQPKTLSQFLARNKQMRGLGSVSEQEVTGDPSSPPPALVPALGSSTAASSFSPRGAVSPRPGEPAEKTQLRQALQRVKQLHGTLDTVNSAYNDAYDQFQRLREEYESRLEECQFFELQCSRLDMHCHELTERLHCSLASARTGPGSHSATGFAPTLTSSGSTTRRCFSLSSLRDVNFWEQRFQELSRLTGAGEADRILRENTAPCLHSPSTARLQMQGMLGAPEAVRASAPLLRQPPGTPAGGTPARGQESQGRAPLAQLAPQPRGTVPAVLLSRAPARGPHSASLSSLHCEEERPSASSPWETHTVRRVASAPLLPSGDVRALSSRAVVAVAGATPDDAPSPNRVVAVESKAANDGRKPAFDAATFLQLSRQPGDKSAALQYVRQSTTGSALNAATVARPVLVSTPSTGSLHGPSVVTVAPQLSSSYSSQELLHDPSRSRASQPPPLSASGRISGRGDLTGDNAGGGSSGSISGRDVLSHSTPSHVVPSASPRGTAGVGTRTASAIAASGSAPAGSASAGSPGTVPITRTAAPANRPQSRGMPRPRVVAATSARGPIAYSPTSLQQRHGS